MEVSSKSYHIILTIVGQAQVERDQAIRESQQVFVRVTFASFLLRFFLTSASFYLRLSDRRPA